MAQNGSHVLLFSNDNKKVFLIRRTDYPIWSITGGGIEEGEDPKSAAIREAKEESGFDIEISDLLIQYQIIDKSKEILQCEYLYKGRVKSGEYKPEFEGNIGKWFSTDKLPLNMTRGAKRKISDLTKNPTRTGVTVQRKKDSISDNLHLVLLNPIFTIRNLKKIMGKAR